MAAIPRRVIRIRGDGPATGKVNLRLDFSPGGCVRHGVVLERASRSEDLPEYHEVGVVGVVGTSRSFYITAENRWTLRGAG